MKVVNILIIGFALFSLLSFCPVDSSARSFRPGMLPHGSVFNCATCHISPNGGGPRNPFGLAVNARVNPGAATQFWSPELAALDSDGDGFTNGEELQDPNGSWRQGQAQPGDRSLVTHPGDRNSKPDPPVVEFPPVELPYSQDFEGLDLGPFVDELGGDGTDWTNRPPDGWTVDNSGVPAGGVTEWQGWSFADNDAWAQVDDQQRSGFTNASGTIAVADPDEWDDLPRDAGTYNTVLSSPRMIVTGTTNGVVVSFDSSWRPENDQKARLEVSFDGQPPENVFLWVSSPENDPNFKPDSVNDHVAVLVNVPSGADEMVLSWALFDAGNNWWWAIDNIGISISTKVPDWQLY